jgi:transcriptional regulator with XRE-family HTH domain
VPNASPSRSLPPAPSGSQLGQRVRELRSRKGLSVASLAGKAGVSFRRLYRCEYEHGVRLRRDELLSIARVLEVDVAELEGNGDGAR